MALDSDGPARLAAVHLDGVLSDLVSAQIADQVLTELEIRAEGIGVPTLGRAVGRLLEMQTRLVAARRVVTVGGAAGDGPYWFARAVDEGAAVRWVVDDEVRVAVEGALRRAGRWGPIEPIAVTPTSGPSVLDAATAGWDARPDLIHLDAEVVTGSGGRATFTAASQRVRPGGLVMATGVLPDGRVDTPAFAVCRESANDPELTTTVLPLRDGVLLALRQPVGSDGG